MAAWLDLEHAKSDLPAGHAWDFRSEVDHDGLQRRVSFVFLRRILCGDPWASQGVARDTSVQASIGIRMVILLESPGKLDAADAGASSWDSNDSAVRHQIVAIYGSDRKGIIFSGRCPSGVRPLGLPRPWTAPLIVVRFDATTLLHIDAVEWAPSTASVTAFFALPPNVGVPPIATDWRTWIDVGFLPIAADKAPTDVPKRKARVFLKTIGSRRS